MKAKHWIMRGSIFTVGMLLLALGITFNTMTGFGTSCITAGYYAIYKATPLSFAQACFGVYAIMLVLEFLVKGKERDWKDLSQLPFSLVYSILLEWMEKLFMPIRFDTVWQNVLLLIAGVICIGIGTSMMLNMKVTAGPPDALAAAIGWRLKKGTGFGKNLLDSFCVLLALTVDLIAHGKLVSIGIGTVVSMICIGRVIAVFEHFCKDKLLRLSGMQQTAK